MIGESTRWRKPGTTLKQTAATLSLLMALVLFAIDISRAEMLRNDAINNDPALEKLCIERSHAGFRFTVSGAAMPFEIDSKYVAQTRSFDSTTTFVALGDGFTATLVQCGNMQTGKFGAVTIQPSQNHVWFWHLLPNAKYDPDGMSKAPTLCRELAKKNLKPGFKVVSIYGSPSQPRVGTVIAGVKIERYNIAVSGTASYQSSGPDMDVAKFTCVFSPALEVKAFQILPHVLRK